MTTAPTKMVLGNTYRITTTFRTFAGVVSDCTGTVTFSCSRLGISTVATRLSTGVYYVDFTPPQTGEYIWRMAGSLEGTQAVSSGEIEVVDVL